MAADITVTCPESSSCSISGANPLFTTVADGVWYPGRILTKTINIKNSGIQIREMALKGTGTTITDTLKNVMNLSLTSSGGTVIWSGNLADFYNKTNINLGIFDPGASLYYNMTISMNSSANDDYQGKQSVFDLTLGFWGEPISTPAVTTIGEVAGTQTEAFNRRWLMIPGIGLTLLFGLYLLKFFMRGGEK